VQTAAQAAAPSLSKIQNPLEGIEDKVREQAAGQDPQAARDAAVPPTRLPAPPSAPETVLRVPPTRPLAAEVMR
jgi:hypothetical protein